MSDETAVSEPTVSTASAHVINLNTEGIISTDDSNMEEALGADVSASAEPEESSALKNMASVAAEEEESMIAEGDDIFLKRRKAKTSAVSSVNVKSKAAPVDDDEDEAFLETEAESVTTESEEESTDEPEEEVSGITAERESAVLQVYRKECMNCTHLVPWATKTFKECHYSSGNKLCPAEEIQIVIYFPTEDVARLFILAEEKGDNIKLAKMYMKLGQKDPWIQNQVNKMIVEMRARRAS